MAKLLVIHGPNLNMLGQRENALYGETSLATLNQSLCELAGSENNEAICFQSNAEHELVEAIQKAPSQDIKFIILNPASLTHTSIALRDALLAVNLPFIEVHLTNIFARESFRHKSYCADIAIGVICGLGIHGYQAAMQMANHQLRLAP